MRLVLAILGCLCISLIGKGQEVNIGLFNQQKTTQILVGIGEGLVAIMVDSTELQVVKPGDAITLSHAAEGLQLRVGSEIKGVYQRLQLKPVTDNSFVKLLCQQPARSELWYNGKISFIHGLDRIRIINTVDLEAYIAGVVEAETGSEQVQEFYKVQACITRTFALANLQKHALEGFNLCDQVHCQVYKGRPHNNPSIIKAVAESAGLILVDRNLQLIDAVFHANCGGVTHNSEDYWVDTIPYLRSVTDSFCSEGRQFKWRLSLDKEQWLRYLYGNFKFPIDQSDFLYQACNLNEPKRTKYLFDPTYKIAVRRIRSDWNLRSTFFSIREESGVLYLEGRGFGHGVGLCQEGAMKMARLAYSFSDILHHYFTDVFVIPKNQLFLLKDYARP
ncbi:MAG TPA: SpoIID/LytB domain-containing protein [Luteibaculaceae bacterium]|nr:SpoIID/LytB domain-containing protein [Luteibaculaceae bacterium]